MDKYKELKTEYNAFIESIINNSDKGEIVRKPAQDYLLQALLKVWGTNGRYSPDFSVAIAAMTGTEFTEQDLKKKMKQCALTDLPFPAFYEAYINRDKKDGGMRCIGFMNRLAAFLFSGASINGDYTIHEASAANDIIKALRLHAEVRGVSFAGEPDDYSVKITGTNEASYTDRLSTDAEIAQRISNIYNLAGALDGFDLGLKTDFPTPPADFNGSVTGKGSDFNNGAGSLSGNTNNTNTPGQAPGGSAGDSTAGQANTAAQNAQGATSTQTDEEQQDPPSEEKLKELMEELDGLVGLANVKADVKSLVNFIKVAKLRKEHQLKVPSISYHLVFTGNPGTGKTTVARLIGQIYYNMGILPKGQLIETDRSSLVAGYVGQTAIKTQEMISKAMGGVLFIDEAYSLTANADDSFGREAVETILKAMEDHRDELVVIVAGYDELMEDFIDSNPGLSSRFSKYFHFPDYTGPELLAIFRRFCKINGYAIDDKTESELKGKFAVMYETREENFGNARTVRNIFEKAVSCQADRLSAQSDIKKEDLELLTKEDVRAALKAVAGIESDEAADETTEVADKAATVAGIEAKTEANETPEVEDEAAENEDEGDAPTSKGNDQAEAEADS